MEIALDRLDARGLTLSLSGREGDLVALTSTTNLRGALVVDGDAMSIRDAAADEIVVGSLRLCLGSVVIAAPAGAKLSNVALTLDQKGDALSIEVRASSLEA